MIGSSEGRRSLPSHATSRLPHASIGSSMTAPKRSYTRSESATKNAVITVGYDCPGRDKLPDHQRRTSFPASGPSGPGHRGNSHCRRSTDYRPENHHSRPGRWTGSPHKASPRTEDPLPVSIAKRNLFSPVSRTTPTTPTTHSQKHTQRPSGCNRKRSSGGNSE